MSTKNRKPTKGSINRGRKKIAFPKQSEQKLVSRPMQIPRAEIATQLRDTLAACEELFRAHGQACSCDLCTLVSNLVGVVRVFAMRVDIT